ncbi:hypothetical protein BDR05DRAFT_1005984 [Suillus weaverae]|nr:hypothetical protein BDR05DRAFT_1005984 [Suillus weaverae]
MHLVSVAEDDDPMDTHRERSPMVEQEPLQFQPELDDAMSAMENTVSRGIEAALRRIFVNKGLPTSMKRSPQRKRMQDKKVKMERATELNHERDFLLGEPAICEDVYSYEYEDGPGPDTKNLTFDLTHGSSTPWNARILDILIEQLQRRNMEEQWPMQRLDGYYKAILDNRYKWLQMTWRAAQPKVMAKGILETAAEVEERLITKRDENLKLVCQTTRRRNKYIRRAKSLEHIINLKKDNEDEDLPAWMWLQKVIKTLGDGGMSSEESDVENDIHCVLWVKNMAWHRKIK